MSGRANTVTIATFTAVRWGAMADKIDPFDVAALERSLNDSATRVSTIWVSFLIFSLYLLTAATTITHRQLFLAEPVKLPVLNIDLPLWGFFFLAPILFVILHAYVLMQVLLLARTAAAYNEAIEQLGLPPHETASLRQRLANTLFAQIFAGSPRERDGWLGGLLKAMAWITLAIAPILILLVFQFAFLPYHSHLATWTHRFLILVELAAAFVLWPLVLDARRDFEWTKIWMQLKRTIALPMRLFGPKDRGHDERVWLRQQAIPLASCVLFVLVSLSLATFPGEPHVNLFNGQSLLSVQCNRWISGQFDRLNLSSIDVVDDEKLAKIVRTTEEKEQNAYNGERTQNFRGRNFQCASLADADLRRTDFNNANLSGANLDGAELQGASLENARMDDASLTGTKLIEASLIRSDLRGSSLVGANLNRAWLAEAGFQGADLSYASLMKARLGRSHFEAATLSNARLQAAWLADSQLQGADLESANLQGATLARADLQGSSLKKADLGGADLRGAQLQGVIFEESKLASANLDGVFLWRASKAVCADAQVKNPNLGTIIDVTREYDATRGDNNDAYIITTIEATSTSIDLFIRKNVEFVPDLSKAKLQETLNARLNRENSLLDLESEHSWRACGENFLSEDEYYKKLALYVVALACSRAWNEYFGVDEIIENMTEMYEMPDSFTDTLLRGLLGVDPTTCQTRIPLSDKRRNSLQKWFDRRLSN